MTRDFRFFLEDILESCQRINRYTTGMSHTSIIQNTLVYDAVLRNIEIVGEAVKQVPRNIQNQYSKVDWRRIAVMRDIVQRHGLYDMKCDTLTNSPVVCATFIQQLLLQKASPEALNSLKRTFI
jgi:uncharacterized protein with HEPN domain